MMNTTQNEPWRVREEWAQGRIERRRSLLVLAFVWGAVIFWNGFIGVITVITISSQAEDRTKILLVLCPFLIVGLFLLFRVIVYTLRSFKFGESSFQMTTVPGIIGGRLQGVVHLPKSFLPEGDATLVLMCQEGSRGIGRTKTPIYRMIWQDQKTFHMSPGQREIPVDFQIPYESPGTILRESYQSPWFTWTLNVNAPAPGVDFAEFFEVPVFKTEKSDPAVGQPAIDPAAGSMLLPSPTRIRCQRLPNGRLIRLPMLGNLVWLSAPLLLIPALKPISELEMFRNVPFSMVRAVFTVAYLLLFFCLFMNPSRIEIEKGVVRIRTGIFGLGLTRSFRAEDIRDVSYEIQPAGTRYNVIIKTGKNSRAAAYNLRRQEEAQWLVAQIREGVGVEKKS